MEYAVANRGKEMSMKARLIGKSLKFINYHNIMVRRMKKPYRSGKEFVPKKVLNNYETSVKIINNREIVTFDKDLKQNKRHIVFIHGGGYIFEMSAMHWEFITRLSDKMMCRTTVINYPLAPESKYLETVEMVYKSYDYLVKHYPNDEFVLIGDSSGGGLALALNQKMVSENYKPLPVKNVLLSPFLDGTLANEDIKIYQELDSVLDHEFLNYCTDLYSGGDDKSHYLISPIYGNLNNLPDTAVFYGTHEVFMADCLKLKELVKTKNSNFIFYEYNGMPHDWGILPIPERDDVIRDILSFINAI